TQIIPKAHYSYFDELPGPLLAEIVATGQSLARVLKAMHQVPRAGFMFAGADVPHTHAHVLPLFATDDLTSRRLIAEPIVTYCKPPHPPKDEMQRVAAEIRQQLGLRQRGAGG